MLNWLKERSVLTFLLALVVAAAGHFAWMAQQAPPPQDRFIEVTARKFTYSPNIIEVNRGDRLHVRLLSEDVHHGFYLDGYELQMTAQPGRDGAVRFVAEKSGRFTFRCSMTCGSFHPYMVGYLRVKPDFRLVASFWLTGGIFGLALVYLFDRQRRNGHANSTARRTEESHREVQA